MFCSDILFASLFLSTHSLCSYFRVRFSVPGRTKQRKVVVESLVLWNDDSSFWIYWSSNLITNLTVPRYLIRPVHDQMSLPLKRTDI
jgi:hypothetical protein